MGRYRSMLEYLPTQTRGQFDTIHMSCATCGMGTVPYQVPCKSIPQREGGPAQSAAEKIEESLVMIINYLS
jgi:hypothetical protein